MTRPAFIPTHSHPVELNPGSLDDAYFYGARSRAEDSTLPLSMALVEQFMQEARDTVQGLLNLHYDRTDPQSGGLPALLRYFYPDLDLNQANVTVTIHADPSPWTVLNSDPRRATELLLSALHWPERTSAAAKFILKEYARTN